MSLSFLMLFFLTVIVKIKMVRVGCLGEIVVYSNAQANLLSHQQPLEIRMTVTLPGLANKKNETQLVTDLMMCLRTTGHRNIVQNACSACYSRDSSFAPNLITRLCSTRGWDGSLKAIHLTQIKSLKARRTQFCFSKCLSLISKKGFFFF